MAQRPNFAICFEGDDPLVEFPAESVTVSIPLTPLGGRLYRLDGIPLAESAAYRDIIEAEPGEGGRLRFVRVVEPSGWQTFDFLLRLGWMETEWGRTLIGHLEALGAHWEVRFGGLLFFCIPPGVDFDPAAWPSA